MSGAPLPRVTPELPGSGGRVKARPEHFVVEELPLYLPSGAGEHLYLELRREGRTTHALARALAELFGLPPRAVGVAGRKDKQARVTQWLSLHLPPHAHRDAPDEVGARVAGELGVEVLTARRHANKLRRGHLVGNRFTVRVTELADPAPALERARAVAAALAVRGLANYYGPQRFGGDGRNAARGRRLFERVARGGRRPRGDRDRLLLSAWQAERFNAWLAERLAAGRFLELQQGDLAHKTDTGGLFPVEDLERERPRFAAGAITYTGPIFGARMRRPAGAPDAAERAVLAEGLSGSADRPALDEAVLAAAGLDGARRDGRIAARGLALQRDGDDLVATFELPKGAFATVLLDELTKSASTGGSTGEPPSETRRGTGDGAGRAGAG